MDVELSCLHVFLLDLDEEKEVLHVTTAWGLGFYHTTKFCN